MQGKGFSTARGGRWAFVFVLAGLCLPGPAGAATDTFTNANGIDIFPGGSANPYPSTISVGGLNGPILDVNATLTDLEHPCYPELDILLEGPGGQETLLLSDSGGCAFDRGVQSEIATITLDDEAAEFYPCDASPSGTFKPTDDACFNFRTVGDFFPPPGPGFGAFPASLSVLDGTNPNGTWNLWVVNQGVFRGDPVIGTIASWSVTITTPDPAPATPPSPSAAPAHTCFGKTTTKEGTTGDDTINGTPGPDVIAAHAGDDRISGLEEDDVVCAGRGDDDAFGGPGDDVLIGGEGSDNLNGGTGNDKLFGGTPGNSLSPTGDDKCKGQKGKDKIKNCESGSP
jgi:Ca2+-binding RTX toxin-like protein